MNTKIELAKDYVGTRYTVKDVRGQIRKKTTDDLLKMFSAKPNGFAYIRVSKEAQKLIPVELYTDGVTRTTIDKICSEWVRPTVQSPAFDGYIGDDVPVSAIEDVIKDRVTAYGWLTVYELNDSVMMSIESAAGIVGSFDVIDDVLTLTINHVDVRLGIAFDHAANYPSFELASILVLADEIK